MFIIHDSQTTYRRRICCGSPLLSVLFNLTIVNLQVSAAVVILPAVILCALFF